LSDTFPIQNCLKEEEALLLLLFNPALKYAIKGPRKSEVLKLNETQFLVYANDKSLLGKNTNTIKTHTLLDANKETDQEINEKKLYIYMFMCC
jgi:hypothetical protein